MEIVYIPQLEGMSFDGAAAPYRMIRGIPESGRLGVADRTITRCDLTTSAALTVVFPPKRTERARDFFVRLVITTDEIPEISFAAPAGETISFEDADESALDCAVGINVFSFTETDAGVFMINRKLIDIDQVVAFDACGGEGAPATKTFKLGAKYGTLPTPVRNGYTFEGWYTASTGGTRVTATDVVRTTVTQLYAQWAVYVDPFVDAICPAKNLTFYTSGAANWFVDPTTCFSPPGAARSGAIGDNQSCSLTTTVTGPGHLAFKCKVSSESYYDKAQFLVDGVMIVEDFSGEQNWTDFSYDVTGPGLHQIECRYSKDGSCTDGTDCCWIDEVVWTPTGA